MIDQPFGFVLNFDMNGSRSSCCEERGDSIEARTASRKVKVQCAQYGGWAHLEDMSDEGMMLRHTLPIFLGDELEVHITGTHSVEGTVFWTSRDACGLRLLRPVDNEALQTQGFLRKANRTLQPLPLSTPAAVATRSNVANPLAANEDHCSQYCEPAQKQTGFVAGLPVKVVLGGGRDREGILRWSKEGVAGIHLREHQNG
ncbi:MAG: PilZ domain-containing protein [Sphingobium sp.]